jgi:O-succinylbenzoate synthase
VEAIVLHRVRLPLARPVVTAWGSLPARDLVIVEAVTAAGSGWGECGPVPGYSAATVDSAWEDLRGDLAPSTLASGILPDRGAAEARAGMSTALLDARLRAASTSLARFLGASRPRVAVGVTLGFAATVPDLVAAARTAEAEGYRRVKLKIRPDADVEPVRAVRAALGSDVALWADANGAYTAADIGHLVAVAAAGLDLIEQPLPAADLDGHRALRSALGDAALVGLDESIPDEAGTERALAAAAADALNVKPARLGGLEAALAVHDLAATAGVPVWCGGMYESGIGRAAALAVAALPGCRLPADLAATDRYFDADLAPPFPLGTDGTIRVPDGPGLGIEVDRDVLARFRTAEATVEPGVSE